MRVSRSVAILAVASCAAAATVRSAFAPPALVPSKDFAVSIDGKEVFVYQAAVHGARGAASSSFAPVVKNGSFVQVPLVPGQGPREVVITELGGPAEKEAVFAALRPEPLGRKGEHGNLPNVERVLAGGELAGRRWKFLAAHPLRCVLEFGEHSGYRLSSFSSGLMVFADWVDTSVPEATDSSVLFFGPGVHLLDEQPTWGLDKFTRGLQLYSHTTLYLAEGAVLLGMVRAFNVQNVSIRGRGIISAYFLPGAEPLENATSWECKYGQDTAIEIVNGSDIQIEGVVVMQATLWNIKLMSLQRVHVHGVKVLSWKCWGDGIDVISSQNVLIEDVFVRSDDDGIAVKGMDPTMNTQGVVVRDAVLWNQMFGNCLEIGFELFNAAVENVTFERIVCLHQLGSAMAIHNGGSALVRNIYYSDIRVQTLIYEEEEIGSYLDSDPLKLFDFSMVSNSEYCRPGPPPKGTGCTDPDLRGLIANVSLKNIDVRANGASKILSQLMGNSTTHDVRGVSITGFMIDGVLAESLADLNLTRNEYVNQVRLLPPAQKFEPMLQLIGWCR